MMNMSKEMYAKFKNTYLYNTFSEINEVTEGDKGSVRIYKDLLSFNVNNTIKFIKNYGNSGELFTLSINELDDNYKNIPQYIRAYNIYEDKLIVVFNSFIRIYDIDYTEGIDHINITQDKVMQDIMFPSNFVLSDRSFVKFSRNIVCVSDIGTVCVYDILSKNNKYVKKYNTIITSIDASHVNISSGTYFCVMLSSYGYEYPVMTGTDITGPNSFTNKRVSNNTVLISSPDLNDIGRTNQSNINISFPSDINDSYIPNNTSIANISGLLITPNNGLFISRYDGRVYHMDKTGFEPLIVTSSSKKNYPVIDILYSLENIEQMLYNDDYLFLKTDADKVYMFNMNDFVEQNSKIRIYEDNDNNLEYCNEYSKRTFKFDNKLNFIDINSIFMTTIVDNKHICLTKLKDFPVVDIKDSIVEQDVKGDYYLNTRVTVNFPNDLKYKVGRYKLELKYRNQTSDIIDLITIPTSKNIYIRLDQGKIFTELSYYLYNNNVSYKIIDTEAQVSYTNEYQNEIKNIYKIFLKDFYYYNGTLFFRLKYLYNNNFNMIVKIYNKAILLTKNLVNLLAFFDVEEDTLKLLSYVDSDDKQNLLEYKRAVDSLSLKNNMFIDPETNQRFVFQRIYNDLENSEKVFKQFQFSGLEYTKYKDVKIFLYNDNGELYSRIPFKDVFEVEYRDLNDIKYRTTDGDFKLIERKFLTHEEYGNEIFNKETFIDNLFDPFYVLENLIYNKTKESVSFNDKFKYTINKSAFLYNNVKNSYMTRGQIQININMLENKTMSQSDLSVLYKCNTIVPYIYVQGRKMSIKKYTFFDSLDGNIKIFIPVDNFISMLHGNTLYTNYIDDSISNIDVNERIKDNPIRIELFKSSVVDNENFIHTHVMSNNDVNALKFKGLGLHCILPDNISTNLLRLFFMHSEGIYSKRINNNKYYFTYNKKLGVLTIHLDDTSFLKENDKLIVATNGVNINNIHYEGFRDKISALPLSTVNNGMMFDIEETKPEDIEVLVNGITLYPYIDYNIYEDIEKEIPKLLIFNINIDKDAVVDVNFLGSNRNKVHFTNIASDTGETGYSLKINDDNFLLDENINCQIFQNGSIVMNSQIEVLNSKEFIIKYVPLSEGDNEHIAAYKYIGNNMNNNLIMIRKHYEDHTHLKEILDYYKYYLLRKDNPNSYNESINVYTKDRIMLLDYVIKYLYINSNIGEKYVRKKCLATNVVNNRKTYRNHANVLSLLDEKVLNMNIDSIDKNIYIDAYPFISSDDGLNIERENWIDYINDDIIIDGNQIFDE